MQEAEGAAGLKQTPPCPACLSAAALAAVSCAWSGPGGRRRGEEALNLALISRTAGTPVPSDAPARLFFGFALTVPQPKFHRLLAGAGAVSRRSSSSDVKLEQPRGTPRPAHSNLPLQGAEFGLGRRSGAVGTPLPCSFTSRLALNPPCLLFTAPEWRGQQVSGPLCYFPGKAGGFAMCPVLGRQQSASHLSPT